MRRALAGRRDALPLGAVLASVLLCFCPHASALNPALDVSQYAHTTWKIRDGFSKGTIVDIAQTQDGYLWLGTEFGLLRFDGVRFVPWKPPAGQELPGDVKRLLVARDGRLWIGTSHGLASWAGGKLTRYAAFDGHGIVTLLEDREGTVWTGGLASPNGGLCALHADKVQCYGEDGSLGQSFESLYEDHEGNLWVASRTGLWRWKPGPPRYYPMPDAVQSLMDGGNGSLAIAMLSGSRQLVAGKLASYPVPEAGRFAARSLFQDRDGGVWIGTTDRGLVHVHRGSTDVFERPDGLSSNFIERIFEDREGDIWVATLDGLDRFRELAIPSISVKQGLSNATVKSVLAAKDGSVWLSTANGLSRWNDGRITVFRNVRGLPDNAIESLFEDSKSRIWVSTRRGVAYFENGRFTTVASIGAVRSIAEDPTGNIWLSQEQSLFRLNDGRVVEQIPWAKLGSQDPARTLVADPLLGGLWVAFIWNERGRRLRGDGGVGYFKGGQVRASYTLADGLGEGHIKDLHLDREGTVWVSTDGGLSRLKDGRFATISSRNGLPCDKVQWVMEDDDRSFWVYMACGLVRIPRSELDAWAASANKDPDRRIHATIFDGFDGVRSHSASTGFSPSVAKSSDGKIWFLPWDGVSIIDPRHLPFNKLPPPVHIEKITADGKTYDLSHGARLPAEVRDVAIDYTALSLVAPEKVHFRYKLEGQDPDWKEVVNDRNVKYSNLPPRNYRFRVMASNNSGVWNETGASLDFSIAPAYYQTAWFRASCVAAFLALLWALYRYRLHQIAQVFNARLEERVDERTRIARDLHDTLLQSFHGLMFGFQAARNMLPRRPEEAMQALDRVLERTEQAIAEGRDAVTGLRASTLLTNELEQAVRDIGNEMSHELASRDSPDGSAHHGFAKLNVVVEGSPRELHPILRDEIYAIAREAVRNAFRHAQARNIEVNITYNGRSFQLRIRDDGKGIASTVVAKGRAGHYGMPGMRERARRIGGRLDVWSGNGAGTEIDLKIPGSIAYGISPGRTVLRLFRKKAANS